MSRWEIISFIKIEIKNKTKESNKIETNALESKAIKLRAGALNWRMKCWRVVSETIKNAHLLMCTGECVCVRQQAGVCSRHTRAFCAMWHVAGEYARRENIISFDYTCYCCCFWLSVHLYS